jgi:hypothetical protein
MDLVNMALMIPIVAILGGITIAVVSVISRARVRELEIKERIAMIERGLVPAPEVDPRGFDHAMNRMRRHEIRELYEYRKRGGSGRHRRAGITLMGVGFGLMVLIGFAGGDLGNGIGVGGFLVVIGVAFFINSLLDSSEPPPIGPESFATPPVPSAPPEPPRPRPTSND